MKKDADRYNTLENQRQQLREDDLRQKQQKQVDIHITPRTKALGNIPKEESHCFKIDEIKLLGKEARLFNWAIKATHINDKGQPDPAIGRCLGTQGINIALKRIQNAIVKRGFVTTRVLAQAQDLNSGKLSLAVVPGRIHTIRFSKDTNTIRTTHRNTLPASPGDVLNVRAIEQALENFKRIPTAKADIQITPAQDPKAQAGYSDVVIVWKQDFPLRLSLSIDDAGSKSTGKYQGVFTASFDNPLGINDMFYVSKSQDLGGGKPGPRSSDGFSLHYSVPFGYWQFAVNMNRSSYEQTVASALGDLEYNGESHGGDIKVSRLMYRDAVRKLTLSGNTWMKDSRSYVDDLEIESQKRRRAGWGWGVDYRQFVGKGTLDMNVEHRRETAALAALPATEGISRTKLYKARVNYSTPFTLGKQRFNYNGNWRTQWAEGRLTAQDLFSIGGRYTVRGFDGELTLGGERGYTLRNDLDWYLGNSGQAAYVGLDYGDVDGPRTGLLMENLMGYVVGMRGSFGGQRGSTSYDIFAGAPIRQPEAFGTRDRVAGFSLNIRY